MLGVALFSPFVVLLLAWFWARAQAARSGLPPGDVIYQDTDRSASPERPLRSGRYSLLGRPDYLISSTDGIIPVDLKKSRCPINGPYDSHAAQLFGYRLLVEGALDKPVPYGVLQYADREVRLSFTSGAAKGSPASWRRFAGRVRTDLSPATTTRLPAAAIAACPAVATSHWRKPFHGRPSAHSPSSTALHKPLPSCV